MNDAVGGSRYRAHPHPPTGAKIFAFLLLINVVYGNGVTRHRRDDLKELHVGALFPMEAGAGGWPGGVACRPAVEMAFEDVNNDPRVLNGYVFKLHHHNSKCQPGLAAKKIFELLYKDPVKLILLSGCSPVTTMVAEAAPVWNLIVLSYGASSPALSNRERFPTLFRTHPSANMQNPTRCKLFERFKWKKITIIQSVEEVFTSTAKDLEEQCRERGIRVERQSFYGDPTDAVKTLVRQDARIILGLFYVTEARRVLCQAYKHGLYGRKYVWWFIGWYADTWYYPPPEEGLNCTAEQMAEAAAYHFTTENIMLSRDSKPAISGMTGLEFQKRLTEMIATDPANAGGFPEAPLAYDAVWAMALAFNCTLNSLPKGMDLIDFDYNNTLIFEHLFKCVKDTQFKGVSGQVKFSDLGDRIARTQIEQLQNGKYVLLGYYDSVKHELDWFGNEIWHDGRGPPTDSTIVKESLLTVTIEIYTIVVILAVVAIIASLGLFVFNVQYSYRSVIIQSQPQCNNILIVGCALCSISLVLMGLPAEGITFPREFFSILCHSRISILMIGFTFAYGSMFAKVWIVHRMSASENQELAAISKDEEDGSPWESIRMLIAAMVGRQALVAAALRKISTHAYGSLVARRPCILNQPIPPAKFYTVIASLFGIDMLIILVWIVVDPLQRKEQRFSLQDPPADTEEDIKLLPILELCESNHQEMWIALILGYKCLLLVFGLFLAYESRNLKLRYINDSRFVGLSIYNVAILSLVTGPVVTLLIPSRGDANFAFLSATVLLCTYFSMGLVFVPKIVHIYRVTQSKDEAALANACLRSTISKSDQLRFEQLMKENSELKKQIDIRENRIAECRKILERRLGIAPESSSGALQSTGSVPGKTEITSTSPPSFATNNNNNSSGCQNDENSTIEAYKIQEDTVSSSEDANQNFESGTERATQSTGFNNTTMLLDFNEDTNTGHCSDFDDDSSITSNEILL
uniref:G_PROTEIN_RECEP_F3_4 domain-containing protein n=1 Tax=Panagrellus redivivus TaxID=6233 RepID=A0A7E4VF70_PANRE